MANNNKRAFYVNGEMLRKIIELRGLTQADVYKAIGIGENTIYRVIKYNRMENEDDFDKMCKYLDINPDVLWLRSFVYKSEEFKKEVVIDPNNIELFIDHLGYIVDDDKKFDKAYIHDFFKGAPQSDYLDPESESFLFEKIIECRDKFTSFYFINSIENKIKDSPYNNDFYKSFDSWFKKNIINAEIKKYGYTSKKHK